MASSDNATTHALGWQEHLALPELGIPLLITKVDTGARTSCLDARNLQIIAGNGAPRVRFDIPTGSHGNQPGPTTEAPLLAQRWVRDSGGHATFRPVIHTTIVVGHWQTRTEITLTERPDMRHRMLLGRRALQGRFLIDPDRTFLAGWPRVTVAPLPAKDAAAPHEAAEPVSVPPEASNSSAPDWPLCTFQRSAYTPPEATKPS